MTLALVRVDDRYIHGQVVVGWGQALGAEVIVLVDDAVSRSEWEQELYRMGAPPGMEVEFVSIADAAAKVAEAASARRRVIVIMGDVDTLVRLCDVAPAIRKVNIGGIHQAPGRRERLPYVFLSGEEAERLRRLGERGIDVSAQDVPTARPVALSELL